MGLDHKADSFTAQQKSQRVQHSELRTGVSQPTDTLLGDGHETSTSQQIQFRRTQKGSWSWELYNRQAPEKYTNWVKIGCLLSTVHCAQAQLVSIYNQIRNFFVKTFAFFSLRTTIFL